MGGGESAKSYVCHAFSRRSMASFPHVPPLSWQVTRTSRRSRWPSGLLLRK